MKFSYVKFGSMKPKVKIFKCWAITSERASEKNDQEANTWLAEKGDNIKVYRTRSLSKKRCLGLWVSAVLYVFYKDIPR